MNALVTQAHTCKARKDDANCYINANNRAHSPTSRGFYTYDKLISRSRLSNYHNYHHTRELGAAAKALQFGVNANAPAVNESLAANPQGLLSPNAVISDRPISISAADDTQSAGFVEWEATVLLEKQNFLDLNNIVADVRDKFSDLFGSKVYLQLVSSTSIDPDSGEGRKSEKVHLEGWFLRAITLRADNGTSYKVRVRVDQEFGEPGAILVENHHPNAFLLRSVSLSSSSSQPVRFVCNSWVYSPTLSNGPRIFFSDQNCLPRDTPTGIKRLRSVELQNKRGDGTGTRVTSDRIYDYYVYNDLGNPDKGSEYARPVLGGSEEYPYPRRCRTARSPTKTDPDAESTLNILGNVYVPRDEQFGRIKLSDFFGSTLKSVIHAVLPSIRRVLSFSSDYKSYGEVYGLYSKTTLESLREEIGAPPIEDFDGEPPLELFRQLTDPRGGDTSVFRFPVPQIIQVNDKVWYDDSEFARELLVGVNPVAIQRLQVFPPTSNLDPDIYGPKVSSITAEQIEGRLEGLTVDEALKANRLYILDYHDVYMPFIERINNFKGKGYATRSLFFLDGKGTLCPIAIELSLPPSDGKPASRKVLQPSSASKGKDLLWRLAKLHVIFNDTGYHELVSHWLRSHASMEPIIIAANRQLSSMHPIYGLLLPHFKNTLNINATARNDLVNCFSGTLLTGGIIEYTFTAGRYAMELSSAAYKDWRFDEQALPIDLVKRGMAEQDKTEKQGVRLLIKDYPFAADALDVWTAMYGWAEDYVNIFYADDASVANDVELQEWWWEVQHKGHADKANEDWWPKLTGRKELANVATIIMWTASGHHAGVNFGQFGYGGFALSRATKGRKLLPEEGSDEYKELIKNPDKFFFETISPVFQSLVVIATLEILSNHAANEEYLGQSIAYDGVSGSAKVRAALEKFQERLKAAEAEIVARNKDPYLLNRVGRAGILYTIMMPSSPTPGLSGRGIPNSVSI